MFEDETIDVACPGCGHLNSLAVRDFEANPEQHIVCEGCKQHVRVDGGEFRKHLDKINAEVRELERTSEKTRKKPSGRKGHFQI